MKQEFYQSWGKLWPVLWLVEGPRAYRGHACEAVWWSSAADWTHRSSKGSGPLKTTQPMLCLPPELLWKPSEEPVDAVCLFKNSEWQRKQIWSAIITSSCERCFPMRSLRLVLSLGLTVCLYCHFSGTKGHFIFTASCRRKASSGQRKSAENKCNSIILIFTLAFITCHISGKIAPSCVWPL